VPIPGTRVPWVAGRFTEPSAQATYREDEADPQGSGTASAEGSPVSPSTFPVHWEAECSLPSHSIAPLFYRTLKGDLQKALFLSYDQVLVLPTQARKELTWWQTLVPRWNRTVVQRQIQTVIQLDASLQGWRAVCDQVSTWGSWSPQECQLHINCL